MENKAVKPRNQVQVKVKAVFFHDDEGQILAIPEHFVSLVLEALRFGFKSWALQLIEGFNPGSREAGRNQFLYYLREMAKNVKN